MGTLTLITGGARSGKSAFALEYAAGLGVSRAFLATAQAHDDEMHKRIERHKAERGPDWVSVEEPLEADRWIRENAADYDVILLDCLTLWLSNVMLAEMDAKLDGETAMDARTQALVRVLSDSSSHDSSSNIVVVTNEVGMGIVPDNALGRRFRDEAGRLNRLVAREAQEVWLVVSGIPVRIKPALDQREGFSY